MWALMLATLTLVGLPLGYILTSVPPSGTHMNSEWHDLFVDTLNATAACTAGEANAYDCQPCTVPNATAASTVCWQGPRYDVFNGGAGVSVSLAELCAACPRGCGPFRGLDVPYAALIHETEDWPEWLLTALACVPPLPLLSHVWTSELLLSSVRWFALFAG